MKIRYKASAKKQLKKLNKSDQQRVAQKITLLSQYPFSGKKLQGQYKNLRSLRSWPYRVIYEIKEGKIIINLIQHRQSVYKRT